MGDLCSEAAQAVPKVKPVHSEKLNVENQAIHIQQIRIGQCRLGRFVGNALIAMRSKQAAYGSANGRIIVNEANTRHFSRTFGYRHF